jgi:hypothetical protein
MREEDKQTKIVLPGERKLDLSQSVMEYDFTGMEGGRQDFVATWKGILVNVVDDLKETVTKQYEAHSKSIEIKQNALTEAVTESLNEISNRIDAITDTQLINDQALDSLIKILVFKDKMTDEELASHTKILVSFIRDTDNG